MVADPSVTGPGYEGLNRYFIDCIKTEVKFYPEKDIHSHFKSLRFSIIKITFYKTHLKRIFAAMFSSVSG